MSKRAPNNPVGWERAKSSSQKPRYCITVIASASPIIKVLTVLEIGARHIGLPQLAMAFSPY